jgi:hypothetical protein
MSNTKGRKGLHGPDKRGRAVAHVEINGTLHIPQR